LAGCWASDSDRKTLQQGYVLYNTRHLDESEAIATSYITQFPDDPNIGEAYYLRGLSRLTRGGDKQAATADLRAAIAKSQRIDLKAKASRSLGDLEFKSAQWQDAKTDYEQALALFAQPNAGGTPRETAWVNYHIGACLQALGQWDQSRPHFQHAIAGNADPELAQRAIARVNATSFSLQLGAFEDGRNAGERSRQLTAAGIPVTIVSEMREGKLLYIVRYGSYSTWQQADVARDRFLSKDPAVTIVP
jgi:tetratricopeptide (TPR) repeat protein